MYEIPTPRPYQEEALQSIKSKYPDVNRLLVAHATGLGKGLFPIWIAQRYEHHIKEHGLLFLAHRRKILFQAYNRFRKAFNDDFWIGLEMGEHKTTGMEDVVFMSVESVGRVYQQRIKKYKDRHFGIIFTDESHHLKSQSTWDRILNYFGVGSDEDRHYTVDVMGYDVKPLCIHLTATPEDRMAPFVDEMAHAMTILDGIKGGWLTDIKSYILDGAHGIEGLIGAYKKYLTNERTLIFASSVDESKELVQSLNDTGTVNAAHIDAETPKDHRKTIYKAFDAGVVGALSNRLVLTEGVDIPKITAILDNAPPSNQRIATQKWGRAVRPHPEANIDQYDTAEERKKAIRESPKPHAKLLCTYDPTETGVSITQALTGRDIDVDEDERLVVEEIVEVLEQFEEERPEVDVEQIENFDPDNITLRKADVFRRTVYNDRLKVLTDIQWVVYDQDTMALWLPQNPFSNSKAYSNAPTVLLLQNTEDGVARNVVSGGWNGEFPAKVKATGWSSTPYEDMQEAIQGVDKWLENTHSWMYRSVSRGHSAEASQNLKEHLRRKDIPVKEDVSDETARLLKADSKIRNKVSQVEL